MHRLAIIALSLSAVLAGCASEGGVRLAVKGRVLASPDDTAGIAGVLVEIPAAGATVLTGPDGRFSLAGTLPEGIDDQPARAAVWFRKAGLADAVHGVTAVPGATTTLVAVLSRPAYSKTVAIPAGGTTVAATADNATFSFRTDSLVDRGGSVTTGEIPVTLAAWDASLPPDATVSPPHLDALYLPVPVTVVTRDGTNPFLRILAACSFAATGASPSADPGVGVDLISQYADLVFGGVSDTDDRLFLVNPETGAFEEQTAGRVDDRGNRITFGIDRAGTWVWAKPTDGTTCVQATVKVGRRPAPGAHVRLATMDIKDRDESLLDERIGADGGLFCLRGPSGRAVRLTAFVDQVAGVTSGSQVVNLSAGGDCATGCPATAEIVLPCESAKDCDAGELCVEGRCSATP